MIPKSLESKIDLKKFATFLKDELNIKGGGSSTLLQGSLPDQAPDFRKDIMSWLERETQ